MNPLIAIVGRPNVGKSQLFNRLAGQRIAVVEDLPGTTRDRLYAPCDIWGRACIVVDTGGLDPQEKEGYAPAILGQAQVAIDEADIIIFLTDAREEPTTLDFEVAEKLRQTRKPVILAANKVDNPNMPLSNLFALRLGNPRPMSALTGHGVGDLADYLHDLLDAIEEEAAGPENTSTKIALVGRPNVGKSSLTNHILGYERTIVSPVPGTTRDAVDTRLEWKGQDVTLIDTAGMRRRSRVKRDETSVEYHMVLRSLRAVERAETAVIVIEAGGVTDQDTKIAGYAHEAGKAVLIAVNKWDLIEAEWGEKRTLAQKDYEAQLTRYLPFVKYAPVHFMSAQTGVGVAEMLDDAIEIAENLSARIPTGPLNDLLQRAMADHPPPPNRGKPIKVRYATQAETSPPTILLFANDPEGVHFSYVRHLENVIRAKYPFRGVPLKIELRAGSGARGREERLQEKREKALAEDRIKYGLPSSGGRGAESEVPAEIAPVKKRPVAKTAAPKTAKARGSKAPVSKGTASKAAAEQRASVKRKEANRAAAQPGEKRGKKA